MLHFKENTWQIENMTFFLFWIYNQKTYLKSFVHVNREFHFQSNILLEQWCSAREYGIEFLITRLGWQPSDYVSAEIFYKVTPPPLPPRPCLPRIKHPVPVILRHPCYWDLPCHLKCSQFPPCTFYRKFLLTMINFLNYRKIFPNATVFKIFILKVGLQVFWRFYYELTI